MEHSMSGGVIKDYVLKTLVKINFDGKECWYFCSIPVFDGDEVMVQWSGALKKGTVTEVRYNVASNESPVPFNRLKEIDGIVY